MQKDLEVQKSTPYILAIESSCDDTSAAVLKGRAILSNLTATQEIHKEWGGVVPELASRAHQENIIPVVDQALKKAGITQNELDAIAFTKGPGLMGSLLVGTTFAKTMALSLNLPMMDVNHMRGHILAHLIEGEQNPTFPFLCLTVSGGHTQIVQVNSPYDFEILGETIDDAAGEAFDKTSKLLGLPYPGGPVMDKLAKEGNPEAYEFPFPKTEGFKFSFSGYKTAVMNFLNNNVQSDSDFINNNINDICASIQHGIVRILLSKLRKASKATGIKEIALAGGVSANSYLRESLVHMAEKERWNTYIPKLQYCTDNAAMIGIAGYYQYKEEKFTNQSVSPNPRWKMELND